MGALSRGRKKKAVGPRLSFNLAQIGSGTEISSRRLQVYDLAFGPASKIELPARRPHEPFFKDASLIEAEAVNENLTLKDKVNFKFGIATTGIFIEQEWGPNWHPSRGLPFAP